MHNLAPQNAAWFEHLTDSVRALGEAAQEWQIADQKAALLEADVELLRRNLHDGKIHVHGPQTEGWEAKPRPRGPHEHAVFDLQKAYLSHRHHTRDRYEHAACLYASGAAWAIVQVRSGEQPSAVLFPLDKAHQPIPGAFRIPDLDGYAGARELTAAYELLTSMEMAGEYAEDLAGRDYVSDHEASEMFDAAAHATGMAGAAYAYGLLAERAVQFVLLGPKEEHRKQLAAARATPGQVAQ